MDVDTRCVILSNVSFSNFIQVHCIIFLLYVRLLLATMSAFLFAVLFTVFIRFLLRLLYSYHGWMYLTFDTAKKPPMHIKLWFLLARTLTFFKSKKNTRLYSYQGTLPSLPVPSISKTLQRHLESVRPLLNDKDFAEMKRLTADFEATIATRLQRYLYLKWAWSDNYVSDWWEEYVYLRGREPLMINSNYYIVDAIFNHPTTSQVSRAANVIHASFAFR